MNSISVPENWKRIPGIDGYLVSDQGRVMSLCGRETRILRPGYNRKGYAQIKIHGITRTVHSLVLEAFHGPRLVGTEARHLDGDPANNSAANLRWGTSAENKADMIAHGTHNQARKRVCPAAHSYERFGYRDRGGKRRCGRCERDRATARRASAAEVDRG